MTKQEIFNTVWHHLFKQKRVASLGAICKYRVAGTDLKCAVGCLIPDELYDPKMEVGNVTNLLNKFAKVLPEWFSANRKLLADLQRVHDGCRTRGDGNFDLANLRERLEWVAIINDLKISKGGMTMSMQEFAEYNKGYKAFMTQCTHYAAAHAGLGDWNAFIRSGIDEEAETQAYARGWEDARQRIMRESAISFGSIRNARAMTALRKKAGLLTPEAIAQIKEGS